MALEISNGVLAKCPWLVQTPDDMGKHHNCPLPFELGGWSCRWFNGVGRTPQPGLCVCAACAIFTRRALCARPRGNALVQGSAS